MKINQSFITRLATVIPSKATDIQTQAASLDSTFNTCINAYDGL